MTNTKLADYLKNKWILIGGLSLLMVVFLLILTFSSSKNATSPDEMNPLPDSNQIALPTSSSLTRPSIKPSVTIGPTQAAQLEVAIQEAQQSAQEYDNWQADVRADYPWIRKLPLATEKYYVYYDLKKQVFIGRLYPARSDNIEKLKEEVLRRLSVEKAVPVENYNFQWSVFPR